MSSVLVVAAHPDDEVLGCGGTIARLARHGDAVHVALLADGIGARHADGASMASDELQRRRAASRRANEILGAASLEFGDFPDNRMDSVDLLDITRAVESLVARHAPSMVLTHHAGDVNIDHQRVHQAVVTACRPQPGHPVRTILAFEVASSTEWQLAGSAPPFVPNWFVDIAAETDRLRSALEVYSDEMRPAPHARAVDSVLHRARWRGATIGTEAAEAFVLGRHIMVN